MRLLLTLPRILALFLLVLPSLIAVSQQKVMQGSDLVMTFYPAGAMVASGQAGTIYPPPTATSFIDAPFNAFTHKLLTYLPPSYVAIYMYSPLVAALFVPFSMLTPAGALIAWQVLNVAALALIAYLYGNSQPKRMLDYFFMLALFTPIFHTMLIGQLGVIFGLLPLALGYYLLTKKKEIAAGMTWGCLALKPQFLPTVMLVCGALFLAKRPKAAIGLVCGLLLFVLASMGIFGPAIFMEWLHSFKMSDTIFSNPAYGFPAYLVVSLPAVILQSFAHDKRAMVKLPLYAFSALIGLYALWCSYRVIKQKPAVSDERALAIVMCLGLLVLPLVLPHFLFYDLGGVAMVCLFVYRDYWSKLEDGLMRVLRILLWWVCNLYFVGFMFVDAVGPLKQWYALALMLFFGFLFWRVVGLSRRVVE